MCVPSEMEQSNGKLMFIPFSFIRQSSDVTFAPARGGAPERLGFVNIALKLAILNIGRSTLPKMGRATV